MLKSKRIIQNRIMKKLQFAILGAAFIAIALSCISVESNGVNFGGQSNPVTLMTKSFDASSIKGIEALTSGGNISVTGDAVGQATIEVLGQGNNGKSFSKEEMMDILQKDYEFSVGKDGDKISAICKRKKSIGWKNSVNISYVIHVSKHVSSALKTSGGNIQLSGLKGSQNFATSGGNIKFSELSGEVMGRTSGGNIVASDSHGDIQAHTSGGNIKMQNLEGTIEMRTSGGNIKGENVTGELSSSTSGGNIDLINVDAALKASTSGGSIEASFIKFSKAASLSTSGGSIRLDVPNAAKMDFDLRGSSVHVGAASQIDVEINKQKDHATGHLNGGGATLDASTSGGSVKIAFH